MTKKEEWRAIVASSLDWEQAHTSLENALKSLPPELRAKKPAGFPHSVWDLLEHIRITQRDLLDFVQDKDYEEKLAWPKDYWPTRAAPAGDKEWNESIATWKKDRQALERFTTDTDLDLTTKIPRGTGLRRAQSSRVSAGKKLTHHGDHFGESKRFVFFVFLFILHGRDAA